MLAWNAERQARWDADKQRILGASSPDVFGFAAWPTEGALLPGEWWRVAQGDQTVAFAWMDVTWGYAPVLVAVAAEARKSGVGAFAMDHLVAEAKTHGLAYVFNAIPATHPDPAGLAAFLTRCGYQPNEADGRLYRRHVT